MVVLSFSTCSTTPLMGLITTIFDHRPPSERGGFPFFLHMLTGLDFTTLGTRLLIPALVQPNIAAARATYGYSGLVFFCGCRRCSIFLLTTWRELESTVCLARTHNTSTHLFQRGANSPILYNDQTAMLH